MGRRTHKINVKIVGKKQNSSDPEVKKSIKMSRDRLSLGG